MMFQWEYVRFQLNPHHQVMVKKSTKYFPNRASCLHNALQNSTNLSLGGNVLLVINEGQDNLSTSPLANFEARLATFSTWPPSIPIQPRILAEAGFYYLGFGDLVTCYSCQKSLKKWQPLDNPWMEHQRHSPRCSHLLSSLTAEYEMQHGGFAQERSVLQHYYTDLPPPTVQ